MKINYGCGSSKLEGYINIDIEEKVNPDVIHDLRKAPLLYEANSMDELTCFHNLEHIELKYWDQFFSEFWRVLKPNANLLLAYPEAITCMRFFIDNFRGMRVFWRDTLYGRQLYPGDYHVTPVITAELIGILKNHGFTNFVAKPEIGQEFNTFLTCSKGIKPLDSEEILRQEAFI